MTEQVEQGTEQTEQGSEPAEQGHHATPSNISWEISKPLLVATSKVHWFVREVFAWVTFIPRRFARFFLIALKKYLPSPVKAFLSWLLIPLPSLKSRLLNITEETAESEGSVPLLRAFEKYLLTLLRTILLWLLTPLPALKARLLNIAEEVAEGENQDTILGCTDVLSPGAKSPGDLSPRARKVLSILNAEIDRYQEGEN